MTTLSVSYRDLRSASAEAGQVARRLGEYADSLQSNVLKKLNNYSGDWTSNISTAKSQTEQKINDLRTEQNEYSSLANNLNDLKQACDTTDVAVRQRVSSLTADFKSANGIRNSEIENAISRFLNSLINETAAGRWLRSMVDQFVSAADYLKDYIRDWYNYDGGKELLLAIATFVLEVGIAILSIGLAIAGFAFTVMGVLTFLASYVLFTIALMDAATNMSNEVKAYNRRANDPATAKRLSEINTAAEYLKSSFKISDDGETYYYDEEFNNLSKGLTIAKCVADLIKLVDGGIKLFENAGKWLTSNVDFKISELFSKNGLKEVFKGLGGKFAEIGKTIKIDPESLINFGRELLNDIGKNLQNEFFDFDDVKSMLSSFKSILSFSKDILDMFGEGKIDFGDIYKDLIGPAIGLVDVPNKEGDHKMITIGDITSKFEKATKIWKTPGSLEETTIKNSCLEKLQTQIKVDVSIKPVHVPSFSI